MELRRGERVYRDFGDSARWTSYRVKVETTDLYVRTRGDYTEPLTALVAGLRDALRAHMDIQPEFLSSFSPVPRVPGAPGIVEDMYAASEAAGVGPMAAVAGAVAERTGRMLAGLSEEVIVENGGDIWLRVNQPVRIAVFAGHSPFSGRMGLIVKPERTPLGVCTSSGKVGPSFSFGRADAATIFADTAALADAVATGAGNLVNDDRDLERAASYAMGVPGVRGVLVLLGDSIIVQGEIELTAP
ncbi:MAG: UPF0280 family protein [Spirochaetes bacterium]|nr:MAG: UPF0280 family protein [Spirochaetota bacterium]